MRPSLHVCVVTSIAAVIVACARQPAAAVTSRAGAATTTTVPTPDFSRVRARMARLVAAGAAPSFTAAVAQGGRIIWETGVGLADRERAIPASPETIYPLASVSKSI